MNFVGSLIALLCFFHGTMGLRLTIHVPSRAVPNSAAHLECNYELENEEQIDTVRLLKDDTEFYHFAPDEIDHISVVPGINENVIDVIKSIGEKSGKILLRLNLVNPASMGSYACEVQTKNPAYRYSSVKEMVVPGGNFAHRKDKIVTHEDVVAEPPANSDKPSIDDEPPTNYEPRKHTHSAMAITVCAFITISINYVARAVNFLE